MLAVLRYAAVRAVRNGAEIRRGVAGNNRFLFTTPHSEGEEVRVFPEHFKQFDGHVFLEKYLREDWSFCALSDPRTPKSHYVIAFFKADEPVGEIEVAFSSGSPFRKRVRANSFRLPKRTGIERSFRASERRKVESAMSEVATLAQLYKPFRSNRALARWVRSVS